MAGATTPATVRVLPPRARAAAQPINVTERNVLAEVIPTIRATTLRRRGGGAAKSAQKEGPEAMLPALLEKPGSGRQPEYRPVPPPSH